MGWVILGLKIAFKFIFTLLKKVFCFIIKPAKYLYNRLKNNSKISRKLVIFRYVIGITLLIVGFLTTMYPFASSYVKSKDMNSKIEQFEQELEVIAQTQESAPAPRSNSNADENNTAGVVTYRPLSELYDWMYNYNLALFENGQKISDEEDFTGFDIDLSEFGLKNDVIGVIEIPKIEQELPLIMNAEYDVMFDGASILGQTSLPIGGENTNCVIASHRGSVSAELFRHIDKLEIGDKVYIRTPWSRLTYQVCEIEIVPKTAVSEIKIQQGRDLVTLMSCHPYQVNNRRHLVYCERVD